jgi:hypothetical protein
MRTNARFAGEWLWAVLLAGLNLLVLAQTALALARRDGWRQRLFAWLEGHAGKWLLAAGFAAAVSMLAMVFDPRYRSFPARHCCCRRWFTCCDRLRASGGGGAAGVHRWRGRGAAVVPGRVGEPTSMGLGVGQRADGRGVVAQFAFAQGLKMPVS